MKSGVYCIYNTLKHKTYIGSSQDIEKRIKTHFRDLKNNDHHCRYLQNAYNKYKRHTFIWAIIELCPIEKLLEREQYYLNKFNKKSRYNLSLSTSSPMKGRKHSKKTIKRFREIHKGNKANLGNKSSDITKAKQSEIRKKWRWSPEVKKKMSDTAKRVNGISRINFETDVCRKIQDNNGVIYKSLTDAAKILKISPQAICDNLKGRSKCSRIGLTFTYVNLDEK